MDLLLKPIPLFFSLHTFQQHAQLNQTIIQQEQQRYESTRHRHFLYHLLNPTFTCDTPVQDIRKEYFRLSQLYHPDKRPIQFKNHERLDYYFDKRQSELNFIKEILLDERKKSIYDKYGKDWSSIAQISSEMNKLYKSKSINKDNQFSEYYTKEILPNTLPKVETKFQIDSNHQIRFHSISHSLLLNKSKHHLLTLRNSFYSLNEKSIPYLRSNLNYDYQIDNNCAFTIGLNYSSLLSGYKQDSVFYFRNNAIISKDDTCAIQLQCTENLDWNVLLLEWNRKLSKHYKAKITYDVLSSQQSIQLKNNRNMALHCNGWDSIGFSFKKNKWQHKLQYHWLPSTIDYSLYYTLVQRSKPTTTTSTTSNPTASLFSNQVIKVGCNIHTQQGVSMELQFQKGLFELDIPIKLNIWNWKTIVSLLSVPILHYVLVKPLTEWMQYKQWKQDRISNYELLAKERKRVEDYLESKENILKEMIHYEESVNGLIIQHAEYGSFKDEYFKHKYEKKISKEQIHIPSGVMDVTHQLQLMVQHSCLELEEDWNGKSEQLYGQGFYDCSPNEPKHLTIYYLFKQRLHKVIVNDTQAVRIPMAKHLIKSSSC